MKVCTVTLLAIGNCGRPAQWDYYDFDFQKPLDYRQLVFRSSMIIVGSVKSVTVARSAIPARKAPELLLDQIRVDVDVENVLRGDWSQSGLRFEFFTYSRKNRGGYHGPPPYRVEEGERRIFFLTKDSDVFRSVADVRGEYSIRVWSGLHRDLRRSEAPGLAIASAFDPRAVGADISAILLGSGAGHDVEAMARALSNAALVSDELTSRRETVSRLLRLTAADQARPLRLEACRILAGQYAGQSSCLYALEKDHSLGPIDRQHVVELIAKRRRRDAELKRDLGKQPLYAFSLDSVTAVRDELRLLLGDPDPELRRLACMVLRQSFGIAPAACGGAGR